MRHIRLVLGSFLVPVALYACADDDNTPPGPKDAGNADTSIAQPDGGADTSVADTAAADQDTKIPLRCSQAELDAPCGAGGGACTDPVANASVTISFPTAPSPAQYTSRCVKVKVGTKIVFAGSFANHPLEANGGDTPTPIKLTNSNNEPPVGPSGSPELVLTMSSAGSFGFQCMFHPGLMFGAIQVVP
jgi:plastocyanin